MKRFTLLIALCLVFCGFTICTSQESFAVGTLDGTVTDAGTALPIVGATIEVTDAGNPVASGTTDDTGFYSIPDIAAGTYDVAASAFGYVSLQVVGISIADDVITTQDFALTALPTHILEGTVTDAGTGDPIEGATVEITGTPIPPATTDSSGFYSFPAVPEGTYDVTASMTCFLSQTATVEITGDITQDFALDQEDTTAPELEVSVSPNRLWPPNHKYRTVTATVEVSDDFDSAPIVTLLSVTSNEPDNGPGDGNTINDIVILDDYTFKLRAERSGLGQGRIYTITYEAVDSCGNTSTGTATVKVPKNNKKVR